jgi:hypothetical protein
VLALNSGELTAVDAAKAKLRATEVQHRVRFPAHCSYPERRQQCQHERTDPAGCLDGCRPGRARRAVGRVAAVA